MSLIIPHISTLDVALIRVAYFFFTFLRRALIRHSFMFMIFTHFYYFFYYLISFFSPEVGYAVDSCRLLFFSQQRLFVQFIFFSSILKTET